MVALSTIGASNQKGILRFGGAAVGGLMGLIALVYLFPNMETIGGFWLVFGAGTAVAAWVNFGTPRISYGGYQIGLAFYKAILQDFGPAYQRYRRPRSCDRRILWSHRVRRRRAFAVARAGSGRAARALRRDAAHAGGASPLENEQRYAGGDCRQCGLVAPRISQKIHDVQVSIESSKFQAGLIESSKFELGDLKASDSQNLLCDAQIIFILLLSLTRQSRDIAQSNVVRTAEVALDSVIATALEALAMRAAGGSELPVPALEDALNAFERSRAGADALDKEAADHFAGRLDVYRALVAAIKRLSRNP